jgi:hypothetical protein
MVAQRLFRGTCASPVAASPAVCFVRIAKTDATDFLKQAKLRRVAVVGPTL